MVSVGNTAWLTGIGLDSGRIVVAWLKRILGSTLGIFDGKAPWLKGAGMEYRMDSKLYAYIMLDNMHSSEVKSRFRPEPISMV